VSRVAANLSVERVRAGFFAGDDGSSRGVTRAIVGAELRSDDRTFSSPRARALAASTELTLTRRDAIADMADADFLLSGTASVRYTNTSTPWPNHTFAVNLSGAALATSRTARSCCRPAAPAACAATARASCSPGRG
jgi:hypothetical protein